MNYDRARVSTDAQDLTSRLAQLKAAGCKRVFREKIGGATVGRPQLRKSMAAVNDGDVVIIPAVDRLSHAHQQGEAIRRRAKEGETLRSIAGGDNVGAADFEGCDFVLFYVIHHL